MRNLPNVLANWTRRNAPYQPLSTGTPMSLWNIAIAAWQNESPARLGSGVRAAV